MDKTVFDIPFNEWGVGEFLIFIDTYLVAIITSVAIITGGIWAVYKYFKDKNKDFYSKILSNVYAPLFEELIKMEYGRKLCKKEFKNNKEMRNKFKIKNLPFIYYNREKTVKTMKIGETKVEKKKEHIFNFDERLKLLCNDESRLQYAPKDLVSLIRSYFFLEEIKGENNHEYDYEIIKLQRKIRWNIIVGYKHYRRKLGLGDISICNRFCISFLGWIWFF